MKQTKQIYNELEELIKMGIEYNVSTNPMFIGAVHTYIIQAKAIERMNDAIDLKDITVEKQYVKNGAINEYMHPAYKDLPKHADSLNKTRDMILKIISVLGHKSDIKDEFDKFIEQ